jgi:signal transduction histidine kinase
MEKNNPNSMILIVDDKKENLQVLGSILMQEKYQLSVAKNGLEALKIVSGVKPDLILLDIMMPELDGFETCKRLKASPETRDIPIIFLTAKIEPEDIVKGFELGAVDYITKPFNAKELLVRVNTHLELKHAHEKIRKSEQLLREANMAKDRFFSIVSRDLKDPFNTLVGFSQLLLSNFDKYPSDKIREIGQFLFDSTIQASNRLENLIQWSRSQTGITKWEPKKIEISKLVKQNIELLKEAAEKKNIRIHAQTKVRLFVYADENMINTVIRNLISNAIKYSFDKGEISITSRQKDGMVEITVSDKGIGIKEKDIEKLFRIDVRNATKGTAGEEGSGLGLILSKKFVEKNGGKIWMESKDKEGSDVSFSLPISDQ